MKNKLYRICKYLLPVVVVCCIIFSSGGCKKDVAGNPVITAVRNFKLSPGDSLISSAGSGLWIVVTGSNLKGALQIYFDGVASSFNEALFSDTSAAVLIPTIPYNNVASDKVNTIRYVTTHGETTFTFSLVPPPPSITSVSNENALPGDSITVYGANFFYIQSVSFAGSAATVFHGSNDGTSMGMRIPAGLDTTKSGPLTITTKSGSAATIYPVNISTGTGVMMNFDGVGTLDAAQNNAPAENNPAVFPGNRGKYIHMYPGVVPANDFGYRNGKRLIWSVPTPWIPAANMNDPITSWALKFEVFCLKPFSNGVIYIEPSTGTWYYAYRFEPWKATPNYKPNGWTTFTIPFTAFLTPLNGNNGTGSPAPTIKDLLVTNIQAQGAVMRFNLCGSTAPVDVDIAIDNIRCVKIQ